MPAIMISQAGMMKTNIKCCLQLHWWLIKNINPHGVTRTLSAITVLIRQANPMMPWKSACTELEVRLEAENVKPALPGAGCRSRAGSALPAGGTRGGWDAASRTPPFHGSECASFPGWQATASTTTHPADQTSSCPRVEIHALRLKRPLALTALPLGWERWGFHIQCAAAPNGIQSNA